MRDARRADAGGLEEARDVQGGRLAFDSRIGGQDDFLDVRVLAQAGQQLLEPDLVGPDAVHGGNRAVQHMVQPLVLVDALDGRNVARVFNHADHVPVAGRRRADFAGVGIGEVAADRAQRRAPGGFDDGLGKRLGFVFRQGKDMESKPLRGFGTDAREFSELGDKLCDRGSVAGHDRP